MFISVQATPFRVTFDNFENKQLQVDDRIIQGHGDIQLTKGSKNNKAIYLQGTDGYLDFGSNFTCGGGIFY